MREEKTTKYKLHFLFIFCIFGQNRSLTYRKMNVKMLMRTFPTWADMVSLCIRIKRINLGALSTISSISIHFRETIMLEVSISNGRMVFSEWLWANHRPKGNLQINAINIIQYSLKSIVSLFSLHFAALEPFISMHYQVHGNFQCQTSFYKMKHVLWAPNHTMIIRWWVTVVQMDNHQLNSSMKQPMFFSTLKWIRTELDAGMQKNHIIRIHKDLSIPIQMLLFFQTI